MVGIPPTSCSCIVEPPYLEGRNALPSLTKSYSMVNSLSRLQLICNPQSRVEIPSIIAEIGLSGWKAEGCLSPLSSNTVLGDSRDRGKRLSCLKLLYFEASFRFFPFLFPLASSEYHVVRERAR